MCHTQSGSLQQLFLGTRLPLLSVTAPSAARQAKAWVQQPFWGQGQALHLAISTAHVETCLVVSAEAPQVFLKPCGVGTTCRVLGFQSSQVISGSSALRPDGITKSGSPCMPAVVGAQQARGSGPQELAALGQQVSELEPMTDGKNHKCSRELYR